MHASVSEICKNIILTLLSGPLYTPALTAKMTNSTSIHLSVCMEIMITYPGLLINFNNYGTSYFGIVN